MEINKKQILIRRKTHAKRRIVMAAAVAVLTVGLTGCGLLDSEVNELNGTIKGNTYNVSFYSNEGENFMNMSGEK